MLSGRRGKLRHSRAQPADLSGRQPDVRRGCPGQARTHFCTYRAGWRASASLPSHEHRDREIQNGYGIAVACCEVLVFVLLDERRQNLERVTISGSGHGLGLEITSYFANSPVV